MSIDAQQSTRIDAARLTAQVLAGSGADPQRVSALFWVFVAMMSPTMIPAVAAASIPSINDGNVLGFPGAAGMKPPSDAS